MKVKLPYFILSTLFLFAFSATAQTYVPLDVTSGYTEDIIANGDGSATSSTTADVDGANFGFISNDFDPTGSTVLTYGLPIDGAFSSEVTPDINFQLADYDSDNSLQISTMGNSGILTFSNSVEASTLYLIGTSGSGDSVISVLVTFTDTSTESFTGVDLPDWFYSTVQPIALSGFGRVNLVNDVIENVAGNPRLYQMSLDISLANEGKTIQSVEVTKSSGSGVVNIMAITAELSPTCYPVTNLNAVATGPDSGTVTWDASISNPVNGYDYYLATDSTAPDETTTPTGTLSVSEISIDLTTLTTGTQYYFWIRSNCGGSDLGSWEMTTFTPGQVSATYTSGDISSLYNASVTTSSTTTCPGVLTVTVPDGYQVSSVDVSYDITSTNNAYMSEQRSFLVCNTTAITEPTVSSGSGGSIGTYSYNRNGLNIADGTTGDVEFEMRVWRTWGETGTGGAGCSTFYSKIDNNTWTVTVTYEATLSTESFSAETIAIYPNPAQDAITVKTVESISEISIYNLLGQRVLAQKGNGLITEVNIAGLAVGSYILKVMTKGGKASVTKVIKQ